MSRKPLSSGFTEAEMMAAAWSLRMNEEEKLEKKSKYSSSSKTYREEEMNSSKERYKKRDYRRSRSRSRDAGERYPPRPIKEHPQSSGRESPSYSPYRGNRSPPERRAYSPEAISSSRGNFGERSRSRSRSRSTGRVRRSRSRESDQRSCHSAWTHDKFEEVVSSDTNPTRSNLPIDYKPPSPTWKSRAGGVAIMKKK